MLITINDINQVVSEIPRDALVEEYDVFQGLGCLTVKYHIEISTKIPSIQHSSLRAPLALKEKLKQNHENWRASDSSKG